MKKISNTWKTAFGYFIYKKGDKGERENIYKGLSVINTLDRLFSN